MQSRKKFWKLGREEFCTKFFDINRAGELIVKEGNYLYNLHELAKLYGTPLEIVFPFIIEKRIRDIIDTFNYYIKFFDYKGKFTYCYPMKVNPSKEFVLSLVSEGANIEVASANELWIVKRLWEKNRFSPRIKVVCNGPKTEKYLALITELKKEGLNIIPIIEASNEFEYLKKFRGDIGVRINLNLRVKSHWDHKIGRFGFNPDEIIELGKIRNLKLLHYHVGSQIELWEDLINPVKKAMELFIKVKKNNPSLDTLDIGGGFAIPYEKRKRFYSFEVVIKNIIKNLKEVCNENEIAHPDIICEWGRAVAAPAQVTIFKVLAEKDIQNATAKKWYIVDGSFITNLPDTWGIKQKWHIVPANNANSRRLEKVWLAGSSCDADDKYTAGGNYVSLPRLEDSNGEQYIVIFDTGAYQDSFASHLCLLSSPTKLLAQNGDIKVIRKRESSEELGRLFGW
jgi:arginine decarboxylase